MSPEMIGLLMIGAMLVGIFVGFPISFTLLFLGIAFGYWGFGQLVFYLLTLQFNATMMEQTLAAVPLFVFMGIMMEQANLMERLFDTVQKLLARAGSLYLAVMFVATIFAAATGIVGASVTILGIMAGKPMIRSGYDVKLSSGLIAAGGTLGILIPPSDHAGGDGPGAGSAGDRAVRRRDRARAACWPCSSPATRWCAAGSIRRSARRCRSELRTRARRRSGGTSSRASCRRRPRARRPGQHRLRPGDADRGRGLRGAGLAGAQRRLPPAHLAQTQGRAGQDARDLGPDPVPGGGLEFLRRGVRQARHADHADRYLLGLDLPRYVMLAIIMALIFLLGWPLEWVPIVLIVVPFLLPLVQKLGFDMAWFGILVAVNLQTAWLSPPVAMSAYFLKGVVPQWELGDIYKGMMQFMVLQLLGAAADHRVPADRALAARVHLREMKPWRSSI